MLQVHTFGFLLLFAASCSHFSSAHSSHDYSSEAGQQESIETLHTYVTVKVISNLKQTKGKSKIDKDGYAKVEDVKAVESVLDFSEISLMRIVEASCDQKVADLKIQSKSDARADVAWNFLSSARVKDGTTQSLPDYSASLRHLEGSLYSLTCVAKNY